MKSSQPVQALRDAATGHAILASITCLHCGQALVDGAPMPFCCFGCRTVYHALTSLGLTRFYELRGAAVEPVGELQLERRDRRWLDDCVACVDPHGSRRVELRAQGIRCTACVWLIEQLFARYPGGQRILVNPALGSLELQVTAAFDLKGFVVEVERFGYLLGPQRFDDDAATDVQDTLLLRLGVCVVLAANSMMFSAAIYLGLRQGALFELLHRLNFAAATLSVLVGGPVFFSSAWQALRRRVLHLDVPIATGIILTYCAATWAFISDHREVAYFDSLAVFIALMLVGRHVQERLLVRNRRELLRDDEIARLRCSRLLGERVVGSACGKIVAGETLLVVPGDLVPLDARLLDEAATCSLDWINGEPVPRSFIRGEIVPAGAFNLGVCAIRVEAQTDFARSPLLRLLRSPERRIDDARGLSRFTGLYVSAVVLLSVGGLAYWGLLAGQLIKGLAAATAVCVVTCPCAIGIAIPLAYDLTYAHLRRLGLFVRDGSLLDRLRTVRTVVFDKTGTLTMGQLRVAEPETLLALPRSVLQDLYDMVTRSLHPSSIAIRRLLDDQGLRYRAEIEVVERVGCGLEARIDNRLHRLGKASWACDSLGVGDEHRVIYAVDGRVVIALATEEMLRADAAREIARLDQDGFDTWILSGDAAAQVARIGQTLGLAPEHVLGGQTPDDKERWIRAHDRNDTLMIGDGVNDAAALRAARCAGTPAIDRGLIAARTDFYFTTPGLAPIRSALLAAKTLRRVLRANIAAALMYNAGAVAVALAGWMQPWVAALAMPLSSIAIIAHTSLRLSPRSRAWTS